MTEHSTNGQPNRTDLGIARITANYLAARLIADQVWWDASADARSTFLAAWSDSTDANPWAAPEAAEAFLRSVAEAASRYHTMTEAAQALYLDEIAERYGPAVRISIDLPLWDLA